jgi:predicted PurR-regulated permease PerM
VLVWLPRLNDLLGVELDYGIGIGAFLTRYSEMAGEWGGKLLVGVSKGGSAVMTAVISLFLVPVLTFYMLRDWDGIVRRLGSLVPVSQQETVFALARETDEVLGAFLRGQVLVMIGLSILYTVGLSISGVQYALAIGVVSGLVSFVPYLGLVFGMTLASLTVALEPAPLWPLIGVFATFTLAQLIEGTVLTPKLVGDQIGLHPVIVIFAIAAGGQLFGFFGVLLALPAAAVLSVLSRFAYDRYLKEHPEVVEQLEAPREPSTGDP